MRTRRALITPAGATPQSPTQGCTHCRCVLGAVGEILALLLDFPRGEGPAVHQTRPCLCHLPRPQREGSQRKEPGARSLQGRLVTGLPSAVCSSPPLHEQQPPRGTDPGQPHRPKYSLIPRALLSHGLDFRCPPTPCPRRGVENLGGSLDATPPPLQPPPWPPGCLFYSHPHCCLLSTHGQLELFILQTSLSPSVTSPL